MCMNLSIHAQVGLLFWPCNLFKRDTITNEPCVWIIKVLADQRRFPEFRTVLAWTFSCNWLPPVLSLTCGIENSFIFKEHRDTICKVDRHMVPCMCLYLHTGGLTFAWEDSIHLIRRDLCKLLKDRTFQLPPEKNRGVYTLYSKKVPLSSFI